MIRAVVFEGTTIAMSASDAAWPPSLPVRAIVFIPTWLWALGVIPMMDPEVYRLLFWAFGHSTQQINVAAMISCWYLLGTLTVGALPVSCVG